MHPLADHCLDVATVFRRLLDLPNVARLGDLNVHQKDRLAVVAYLHDFGKCNRGFQAKADPAAKDTAGHVLEGLALLWDLGALWPPGWKALRRDIDGWFKDDEQAEQMLLASLSHHGRPVSKHDYDEKSGIERKARDWWTARDGYDPLAALDALAATMRGAFPLAFGEAAPIDATQPCSSALPGW